MSRGDLDQADRDPLVLLRALGSDEPAPRTAARNVLGRLVATLPLGALEITAADVAEGPLAPTARTEVNTALASGKRIDPLQQPTAPRHGRVHWLRSGGAVVTRPWAWAIALTGVGVVTGGALHAAFAPEKLRVVYLPVDRTPAASTEASPARAPSTSTEEPTLPVTIPELPSAASGQSARASTRVDASSWSKERALLDAARGALAKGEPEACLSELAKHARAFPSGMLAEEREALAVNALVGVGRYSEARQKADLFARRHPNSFLAPSVDAAILAIP
jgi:hypothetical protein